MNGFDLLIAASGESIHTAAIDLQANGVQVKAVQVDLADHEGIHKLIHAIQSAGRPVDAVAINAGIGVSGRFVETDLADEMKMVRLNVISVLHLAKYVVRDMVARGAGRILITSSIAGTMPTRTRLSTVPLKLSIARCRRVCAKN